MKLPLQANSFLSEPPGAPPLTISDASFKGNRAVAVLLGLICFTSITSSGSIHPPWGQGGFSALSPQDSLVNLREDSGQGRDCKTEKNTDIFCFSEFLIWYLYSVPLWITSRIVNRREVRLVESSCQILEAWAWFDFSDWWFQSFVTRVLCIALLGQQRLRAFAERLAFSCLLISWLRSASQWSPVAEFWIGWQMRERGRRTDGHSHPSTPSFDIRIIWEEQSQPFFLVSKYSLWSPFSWAYQSLKTKANTPAWRQSFHKYTSVKLKPSVSCVFPFICFNE